MSFFSLSNNVLIFADFTFADLMAQILMHLGLFWVWVHILGWIIYIYIEIRQGRRKKPPERNVCATLKYLRLEVLIQNNSINHQ